MVECKAFNEQSDGLDAKLYLYLFIFAFNPIAIFFWVRILLRSVLARNEEFSKIAVINFFLQFSKKKYSYLWGGFCGGNFEIYHANQQFSTCMLIDTHVNKRERYTISPVHDCACYCMHTCLLMLIKIQIENTQSTLESKNISFMGVLKKL